MYLVYLVTICTCTLYLVPSNYTYNIYNTYKYLYLVTISLSIKVSTEFSLGVTFIRSHRTVQLLSSFFTRGAVMAVFDRSRLSHDA